MVFRNRAHAGRELAKLLGSYRGEDCVVYALPRGGVPVAFEIAVALSAPLDLIVARKIGHPKSPEYGIGAVTELGHLVANERELSFLEARWFEKAAERERSEAVHSRKKFCGDRPRLSAEGKAAIVVDDGVATGYTLRAAIADVRRQDPKQLVVAVPVAPAETANLLRTEVDELVVVHIPEHGFGAVGSFYEDFHPVSDGEVIRLRREANRSFEVSP